MVNIKIPQFLVNYKLVIFPPFQHESKDLAQSINVQAVQDCPRGQATCSDRNYLGLTD